MNITSENIPESDKLSISEVKEIIERAKNHKKEHQCSDVMEYAILYAYNCGYNKAKQK